MKILILGGYGVFGGRLVQLLADLPELSLLIAGRSLTKAQAFCDAYQGASKLTPVLLDRADIAQHLRIDTPDLIVDASGPFQNYGDDRYFCGPRRNRNTVCLTWISPMRPTLSRASQR